MCLVDRRIFYIIHSAKFHFISGVRKHCFRRKQSLRTPKHFDLYVLLDQG